MVISPVSGIILIYNGTPGLGTLAASLIASTAAFPTIAYTDQYGNNCLAGETWYGFAAELYAYVNVSAGVTTYGFASGAQPCTFPTSTFSEISAATFNAVTGVSIANLIDLTNNVGNDNLLQNSANNGNFQVANQQDTNIYNCGKQFKINGGQTLTTSPTAVLSFNVLSPTIYHYKVFLVIQENAAAGTFSFGWDGSASTSGVGQFGIGQTGSAPDYNLNTNGMPALATSLTMNNTVWYYTCEGEFSVSTSGVLNLRGQISAAADTASVINGSWGYVEPMN